MAREQALQALYSVAIGNREPDDVLGEVVSENAPGEHRSFVRQLVIGTLEHQTESDETISPLLVRWTIERLPALDRLILRMATYELRHRKETPSAVVINEAVELAKKFSTEDSGRYVNGVLNAVAKEHAQA
jgi:N utilization substance protein B